MAPRFLALLSLGRSDTGPVRSRVPALATGNDLQSIVMDNDRAFVMVDDARHAAALDNGRGVVLGSVYERGSYLARRTTPDAEQDAILTSRGERLLGMNWGNYVAILVDGTGGDVDVLRSPFGSLPCYFTVLHGVAAFASDLAMMRSAGWQTTGVSWRAVVHHLIASDLTSGATCLDDVLELRGGERIHVGDRLEEPETLWWPQDQVRPNSWSGDIVESSRRNRDAADTVVRCVAGGFDHPLLLMSGGLDSSVVAACLSSTGRRLSALNLVSRDPSGDERGYARAAAAHLNIPLVEAIRDVRNVDIGKSDAAHLPRPSARAFTQDSRRAVEAVAAELGADGIIDGAGGDNVFCSLQSAAPVADAYLAGNGLGVVVETARNISGIAEASVPRVLAHTARRVLRRRAYRWPADKSLLDRSAAEIPLASHPWLEPAKGVMPGKMGQIGLLVAAQSWAERLDPQARVPSASPLVSQPLAEVCLRVPTWFWYEDGRNRAAARRAFANRLPAEIIARRSKSSPDSFVAELFEHNRPAIAAMLLDGKLAGNGIIDRKAVERTLNDSRPAHGETFRRIMRLVDAEAWLAVWS